MSSKLFLGSALMVAVAAGGMAYAAQQEMGDITRAEAIGKAREHFARMDANKDGKLDEADRGAHHQQMAAAMFDSVDTDRNGSISREEWNAGAARLAQAHGGPDGPGPMAGMHRPAMFLMRADTNGDRAISAQEFEAQALARFDAADANKDGTLSASERQAARKLMRRHVERD